MNSYFHEEKASIINIIHNFLIIAIEKSSTAYSYSSLRLMEWRYGEAREPSHPSVPASP